MTKGKLIAMLLLAVAAGGISFAIFNNTHEWGWWRNLNPIAVGFFTVMAGMVWGK